MNQILNHVRQQRAAAAQTARPAEDSLPAAPTSESIGKMLQQFKPQLVSALPAAAVEQAMSVMLTELHRNQLLATVAQHNPMSFVAAVLRAFHLGLEIGDELGHAYLKPVVKQGKEVGQWAPTWYETELIIGYKGMVALARRSGQIEDIYTVEVFQGEAFEVTLGLERKIKHTRRFDVDMGPESVVATYAVAKLKTGEVLFEVMGRGQIDAARARSEAGEGGYWATDWIGMAKKAPLRNLFPFLPINTESPVAAGLQAKALKVAPDVEFTPEATPSASHSAAAELESATPLLPQEVLAQVKPPCEFRLLQHTLDAIVQSSSLKELDEVYLAAEGQLSGGDLDIALKAFRAKRQGLKQRAQRAPN